MRRTTATTGFATRKNLHAHTVAMAVTDDTHVPERATVIEIVS